MFITKSKLVTWMSRALLDFRCTFSTLLRQSPGNQLKRTETFLSTHNRFQSVVSGYPQLQYPEGYCNCWPIGQRCTPCQLLLTQLLTSDK